MTLSVLPLFGYSATIHGYPPAHTTRSTASPRPVSKPPSDGYRRVLTDRGTEPSEHRHHVVRSDRARLVEVQREHRRQRAHESHRIPEPRCRCGGGEPSRGADAARASPSQGRADLFLRRERVEHPVELELVERLTRAHAQRVGTNRASFTHASSAARLRRAHHRTALRRAPAVTAAEFLLGAARSQRRRCDVATRPDRNGRLTAT